MIDGMKIYLCKWSIEVLNNYDVYSEGHSIVIAQDEAAAYSKIYDKLDEMAPELCEYVTSIHFMQEAIV